MSGGLIYALGAIFAVHILALAKDRQPNKPSAWDLPAFVILVALWPIVLSAMLVGLADVFRSRSQ
jgi:ABC-type branched-subunit amino acid transport system permease subunit